jgi:hypothetical protein
LVVLKGGFIDYDFDSFALLVWGFFGALALDIVAALKGHQHLLDFAPTVVPDIERAGHWLGHDVNDRF